MISNRETVVFHVSDRKALFASIGDRKQQTDIKTDPDTIGFLDIKVFHPFILKCHTVVPECLGTPQTFPIESHSKQVVQY